MNEIVFLIKDLSLSVLEDADLSKKIVDTLIYEEKKGWLMSDDPY